MATTRSIFSVKIIFLFLSVSLIVFSSCKKNGLGGNSKITGFVKHHDTIIPNAVVYIQYGVQEFPGTNTSLYDDTRATLADGKFTFDQLLPGDYYLYAKGFDSTIMQPVSGGIYVPINKKNSQIRQDVAVTE